MKSPYEVYMESFKNSGLDVQVMRKNTDGVVQDARATELETLTTKAKIASTAQLLAKLSPAEKTAWALETKIQGNELFKQGKFKEATQEYIEALTATSFQFENNVDILVVPVLCNLAACCIELKEWGKVIQFCEQAIQLRPECSKAFLRKGIGLLRLQEYQLAIQDFHKAHELSFTEDTDFDDNSIQRVSQDMVVNKKADDSKPVLSHSVHRHLSHVDRKRINTLVAEAKRGIKKDTLHREKQRQALTKAFLGATSGTLKGVHSSVPATLPLETMASKVPSTSLLQNQKLAPDMQNWTQYTDSRAVWAKWLLGAFLAVLAMWKFKEPI